MINYQFFPRSHGLTQEMEQIVDCFKAVDAAKSSNAQLRSNDMLSLVRPHLEQYGFKVESGKAKGDKIPVPVLFGENNSVDKSFFADALSQDRRIVIEVEAGRAIFNNQFLKDIFQACMMFDVEYLAIAVLNEYHYKVGNKNLINHDYQLIKTFLETMYVSNRIRLPLKGILLIGY